MIRLNVKNLFGYILIAIALCLPILIAFPQFYSNDSSGRINKEIQLNFEFLNKEKSPTVMLFFGYVGCGDICSPALTEVGRIYNRVDKDKTNVYFLNVLDTTRKDTPQSYAKGFHKDFKGVYLDSEGINNVAAELNLSIIKVNDQEVSHTGHLFVLRKDYVNKGYTLKYIYTTRPFNEKAIIADINVLNQTKH